MTDVRQLRVDDATVTYREAGQGPALVLLHGIGSGALSFQPTIDRFKDRFRVIAWNAPGYGGSTPLAPEAPLARDYAARLAGFLDALGERRVFLAGHSLGALMAGSFAAGWPLRVKRLLLASAALGHARLSPEARAKRLKDRLDDMAALGPAGLAEKRAASLLVKDAVPEKVAQVRRVMAALDPAGYAQAARMLSQGDLLADAPAIKAPTLVVCGAKDATTTPATCRELADAIQGARYGEIPDAAHGLYVDAPKAFWAALDEHMKDAA